MNSNKFSFDDNIRYIGIANLVEEKIIEDLCPLSRREKINDVIITI